MHLFHNWFYYNVVLFTNNRGYHPEKRKCDKCGRVELRDGLSPDIWVQIKDASN